MPSIYYTTPDAYDGVGSMFTWLYGKVDPSMTVNAGSTNWASEGVLREFDQHEFVDAFMPWEAHGLAKRGFVYYPNACTTAGSNCKVHMAMHGCGGASVTKIGLTGEIFSFAKYKGYSQYAAANKIIIIYPQAQFDQLKQWGECFDFQGKIHWDLSYTKESAQMRALKRMFDRVTSEFGSVRTDLTQNNINGYVNNQLANRKTLWVLNDIWTWFTFRISPTRGG